jgi:hypothetical protein
LKYLTQGFIDGYGECLSQLDKVIQVEANQNKTTIQGLVNILNAIILFIHQQHEALAEMQEALEEQDIFGEDVEYYGCDECEDKGIHLTLIIGGKNKGGYNE